MTNYLIKYATSKSMRINHNICNNARMRKRNRSRMRKKIGHAELLSNGEIHSGTVAEKAATNSNNKKHMKNKQKSTTNN